MVKLARIILVSLFLHACAEPETVVLEARSNHIIARATIALRTSDFREGFVRVSGNLIIQNTSEETQKYSNRWLWLSIGDGYRARTYLGNLTSHYIDEGPIDIVGNDSLDVPAYWVFPDLLTDPIDSESVSLELVISD